MIHENVKRGAIAASASVTFSLVAALATTSALAQSPPQWVLRSGSGPSPRMALAMTYDTARGVTVLYGGLANANGFNQYLDDTWEWNGTAWTRRSFISPPGRWSHAMAFDEARAASVLYGGLTSGTVASDTWEWNGSVWTRRLVDGPGARYSHAMAYDAARRVTVLFGGDTYQREGDTWEWNGSVWTQRYVIGPPPRSMHAIAFDSTRGVIVLFGGAGVHNTLGDTWEWNGTVWTQRMASSGPTPRYGHTMAFDATRGVTVLFGGIDSDILGDTWEWNGGDWTQRAVIGPPPFAGMTYDHARSVAVLFGGAYYTQHYSNATWELGTTCYADCDGSTTPPILDINDLVCFLNRFAAGDGYANCDGSTRPAALNIYDFICFLNKFAAGCS